MRLPPDRFARLVTDFRREYVRLARVIVRHPGFLLQPFVAPNHEVALGLTSYLEDFEGEVRWVHVREGRGFLSELLVAAPETIASVVFVETLGPALQGELRIFNQKRDELPRVHPRPLLWGSTPALLSSLWQWAPDLWSIAEVPVRCEALPDTRGDRRQRLTELLMSAFSGDELRRLMMLRFPEIVGELPGPGVSMAEFAVGVVEELKGRGEVDLLLQHLSAERPRFQNEIGALAHLWAPGRLRVPGWRGSVLRAAELALRDRWVTRGFRGVQVLLWHTTSWDSQVDLRELVERGGAWESLVLEVRETSASLESSRVDWGEALSEGLGRARRLSPLTREVLARAPRAAGKAVLRAPGEYPPIVIAFADQGDGLVNPLLSPDPALCSSCEAWLVPFLAAVAAEGLSVVLVLADFGSSRLAASSTVLRRMHGELHGRGVAMRVEEVELG